jgi:hypothetical protein
MRKCGHTTPDPGCDRCRYAEELVNLTGLDGVTRQVKRGDVYIGTNGPPSAAELLRHLSELKEGK